MKLAFLKFFKKKFGIRIFAIGIAFIFVISFSFTAFFIYHQSKSLTDTLIQNNLLLADILAHNSRIGVFSENEELLKNPVDGIFQQKETEEVSIYNLKGRLLMRQARSDIQDVKKPENANETAAQIEPEIFDKLKTSPSPLYLENQQRMEFWSPVVARSGYREAESLFVETIPLPQKEHVIGFVRITVGKSALDKKLGALLVKSVMMGILFLIVGSGIIYFAVKRVVNPLNTLIEGVQSLEKGAFGEKVPVETDDEIGKLAAAFNQMSESLLKRETETKQLEERLRHAQRMEAIGTLAGGIAHDFNNILGVIVGYAELALLDIPKQTPTHRSLSEIFKASSRAKDLVKQILTFSRQTNQERHPLLIKPIVEEVLKMMRASLPSTIEMRHTFKPGLSPILSDPTQIHQVLMNLCTNAGHAMEEGGGVLEVNLDEVEIGPGNSDLSDDMQPGRYQILTVSDTGHGMDASIKERIFDPYFTTKGPGKGSGMGLSVTHGIVKSHGGKIDCRSEPGKGAAFSVFFPTIEEKTPERQEQDDSIPRGKERILFVDDETALADIGMQMLQNLGYDVVAKTSSIEALETFRTQPDQFDIIVTDSTMPNMTGVELAKNIKRIRSDIPILLCTGYSEGISDETLKAIGIAGLLMKPIIREKIARGIRHALEHG
ncbi:MAG: response regulator [Deltaproteobacteria bacterium]|nr:response regulator [Deltaproteobacteria bacterium]